MGMSKKYANVKVGGNVGPQNLLAATNYTSAAIPCKGARMVLCKISGSNNAAWQSFTANFGEDPAGVGFAAAGSNLALVGNAALNPTNPGGVVIVAAAQANAGKLPCGFVAFVVLSHATTPPQGVQWDVEVVYDMEADAAMAMNGQAGLTPA